LAQVRGAALISPLQYMRTHGSEQQQARILSCLNEKLRDKLLGKIVTSRWYPLHYLIDLCCAIDSVLGTGDKALLLELGQYAIAEASRGVYKVFFKLANPEAMIKRTSLIWGRYFDSGQLTIALEGEHRGRSILRNFDKPEHAHCLLVQGWIRGVLTMTGAKNIRLENVQCRQKEANVCEFTATWE
jgi:predicted hydrocarbon binding protein